MDVEAYIQADSWLGETVRTARHLQSSNLHPIAGIHIRLHHVLPLHCVAREQRNRSMLFLCFGYYGSKKTTGSSS